MIPDQYVWLLWSTAFLVPWAALFAWLEALSCDELQHTLARRIRGETKETVEIPPALAPLAKAGA